MSSQMSARSSLTMEDKRGKEYRWMSDVWRGQKRLGCSSFTKRASILFYLPCLQATREDGTDRATLGTALNGRPYSVVAGNSQLEQILEQGFVLPSDHEPGQDYVEPETNLRDILSSSDPLRSTVEVRVFSCVVPGLQTLKSADFLSERHRNPVRRLFIPIILRHPISRAASRIHLFDPLAPPCVL